MSAGRVRAAAIASTLLAACQVSYLAQQGDKELAQGDPMRALALYDQALRGEITSEDERAEIAEKRYDVASAVAQRTIAEARLAEDEGHPEEAFDQLGRLVAAGTLGVEEDHAVALGLLHALGAELMDAAEAQVAAGKTLSGARLAQGIVARFPAGIAPELSAREKRLRTVAAQHHLRLASEAHELEGWRAGSPEARGTPEHRPAVPAEDLPGSRYMHLRIAQYLDPTLAAGDVAALEKELAARATVPIVLLADPAECGLHAAVVAEQLGPIATRPVADPIRIELVLDRCTLEETNTTTEVLHSYADGTGTSTITVDVHRRSWSIGVSGRMKWIRPAGSGEVPIDVGNTLVDDAYWAPDGAKLYTFPDKKQWIATILGEVARNAINYRSWLDAEKKQLLINEASQAYGAGQRTLAEDRWVLLAAGNYLYATETIEAEYGMQRGELASILSGKPAEPYAAPAAMVIPAVYSDVLATYQPIENRSDARGVELLVKNGVDLSWSIAQSPLAGAELAGAFNAGFRMEGGRYTLRIETPWFGGQASGFSLGLLPYLLEADDDGFTLLAGLRFTREDADGEETYASLGPVIGVEVPVGRSLILEASIELNALAIEDLVDDDPDDPLHYSPISVGLILDLWQHAFLHATATHFLGVGSREPIHLGLELGLRL